MQTDTTEPIQDQALDHIRELLAAHWREAKDSADDDGKFAIGLRIIVQDGAPTKLKVKCSISKTMTDEPKRSGDSQQHAARRARRSRGKPKARSKTRRR
jgi:hypothetical protein